MTYVMYNSIFEKQWQPLFPGTAVLPVFATGFMEIMGPCHSAIP